MYSAFETGSHKGGDRTEYARIRLHSLYPVRVIPSVNSLYTRTIDLTSVGVYVKYTNLKSSSTNCLRAFVPMTPASGRRDNTSLDTSSRLCDGLETHQLLTMQLSSTALYVLTWHTIHGSDPEYVQPEQYTLLQPHLYRFLCWKMRHTENALVRLF